MLALTAIFAAVFAGIHLFTGKLHFLDVLPRSRWLSAAGGIAVAYVFLHILPELSLHQETLAEELGVSRRAAEAWVYITALAGLAAFYGLERAVKASRKRSRERVGTDAVHADLFWLHIVSFGLYNVLIGYLLLHREQVGFRPMVMYFLAMGLHFVTTDFGLRSDHKARYDRLARWITAACVLIGWALGLIAAIPQVAIGFLFAFLAGGVVLNALKEELPEERQSRYWPFLAGAAGYSLLLLAA